MEAIIWLTALVFLAFQETTLHHYTLCPFHNLGWDFCPGCGIGRSISSLLHGDFKASFQYHPLGFLAVIILIHRIFKVIRESLIKYRVIFNTDHCVK